MSTMKEIKSCEILLGSKSLYLPINNSPLSIKGNIKLNLTSPLKLTQVVLKLHGFSQFNQSQKATTRNFVTKDLIKQKQTIVNVTKTYNTGENLLPFTIVIKQPQNLYASVEAKHAAIRYVLTAELTKASPHAIYKTNKNIYLRRNFISSDGINVNKIDVDEKAVYQGEREGLLKYIVLVTKYLIIDDDAVNDQVSDDNSNNFVNRDKNNADENKKTRGVVMVDATFESLDKAGVKEVKVEAFEYEMYNFSKFNSSNSPNSSASSSSATSKPPTTPVKSKPITTTRSAPKIHAFSNVAIPSPHHTTPLLAPPLTIPLSSSSLLIGDDSPPNTNTTAITTITDTNVNVKFEIPINSLMKPDLNVSFLEIKHEFIMTLRFDKFMLAPLKLEVPVIVITKESVKI
ncbi:4407_t:CDS:2 [Entrophospora sp. SA101]|nr:10581_t:CDS:2 [Entrophospora sp. SA101]CAJ0752206.1 15840_t:CDS:2 [Entrophospora sp. SA101]CAJ0756451.1 4407_t:CDS:2 [Entrophospora sp. SA101]CAJ0832142.1 8780_t:CDS:2 [Entrophospora sp. SA101]CAJ0832168.1 8790_t:CDS:2 [Entrophospora sp. SA101]